MYFHAQDNGQGGFAFSTRTSTTNYTRLHIANNGNVGIGTVSPNYPFHVYKNDTGWLSRFQNTNTGGSNVYLAHGGGYGAYINAGTDASASTYALNVNKAGTSYLYVRGDGNVGIGDSTPAWKLDVAGTIRGYTSNAVGVYGESSACTGVYGYGTTYDFYAGGVGTNYGPFTGSHEVILVADFPENVKPGMIVSTTGEAKKREGSISSTLPTVRLTDTANDSQVFGVFAMISDLPDEHWYEPQSGEQAGIVNALGDGRIWVTNYAGEIKNGDRIISSPIPGYGMKVDGSYPLNHVVAKITEDIDWSTVTETVEYDGVSYKAYLAAGIYDTLTISASNNETQTMIVSTGNGNILEGDHITSESGEYGIKAVTAGPTIGKALESTDVWNDGVCNSVGSFEEINWPTDDSKPCYKLPDGSYVGKIMAFVNVGWHDPDIDIASAESQLLESGIFEGSLEEADENVLQELAYNLKGEAGETIERIGRFKDVVAGGVRTALVDTTNLTADTGIVRQLKVNETLIASDVQADTISTTSLEADSITLEGQDLGEKLNGLTGLDIDSENEILLESEDYLGDLASLSQEDLVNAPYLLTNLTTGQTIDRIIASDKVIAGQIESALVNTTNLMVDTALVRQLKVESINLGDQDLGANLSALNADLDLSETGDVVLESTIFQGELADASQDDLRPPAGGYDLRRISGEAIGRIGTFKDLVVGGVKAALVDTTNLIADTVVVRQAKVEEKIISPIVETEEIRLMNNDLRLTNKTGETVTMIDQEGKVTFGDLLAQGDATISGTLTAQKLKAEEANIHKSSIVNLQSETATVSGNLYAQSARFEELRAKSIKAESIEGLEGRIANILSSTISAQTINTYAFDTATPEGSGEGSEPSSELAEWEQELAEILAQFEAVDLATASGSWIAEGDDVSHISISNLDADMGTFNTYLAVLGQASIVDLEVTNTMNLAGNLQFTSETLYLQPSGQGKLDLMAGAMTIDGSGDVYISGDLYIAGKTTTKDLEVEQTATISGLFADLLGPIDRDLTIQLDQSASPSGKLRFADALGNEVASIDASGSAKFNKLIIANAKEATPSGGGFGELLETQVSSSATAGEAILPANELELVIENNQLTEESLVYITPTSDTQNKVLYVKSKFVDDDPEITDYFVVAVNQPVGLPVKFNWWIIN